MFFFCVMRLASHIVTGVHGGYAPHFPAAMALRGALFVFKKKSAHLDICCMLHVSRAERKLCCCGANKKTASRSAKGMVLAGRFRCRVSICVYKYIHTKERKRNFYI